MDLNTLIEKLKGLDENTSLDEIFSLEELEALVENIDQLDELSKDTLKSYVAKAVDSRDENKKRAEKLGKLAIGLANSGIGDTFDKNEKKFRTRFRKNDDARDDYNKSRELSSELTHRRRMAEVEAGKRGRGITSALGKLAKEDVEGLNELSKDTLKSYVSKALDGKHSSLGNHAYELGKIRAQQDEIDRITNRHGISYQNRNELRKMFDVDDEKAGKTVDLYNRRIRGINLATKKLAKEDVDQLDELSRGLLARYTRKAASNKSNLSRKEGSLSTQLANARWLSNEYQKPDEEKINRGENELNKINSASFKRDLGIHRALKRLAKEDVDQLSLFETLASDTLVAGAAPGETKTSYIQQLIAATPHMSIEDLSNLLNQALELSANQNGDKAGDALSKNTSSIAIKTAVKEDVDSLFSGQELSEEFKEKVSTLFEAAIHTRVNDAILELTQQYDALFEEAVGAVHDELSEELEVYLDQFTKDFMIENEIAIESNLRANLAESFLEGLKNLFEEHYVEIPESKIDVLESLAEDNELLNEKVHQLMLQLNEVSDIQLNAIKEEILDIESNGLTLTDAEKLRTLSESIDFNGDVDSFTTKLGYIKENYFNKKPSMTTNLLTEQFDGGEATEISPMMKLYADVIGNTTKN